MYSALLRCLPVAFLFLWLLNTGNSAYAAATNRCDPDHLDPTVFICSGYIFYGFGDGTETNITVVIQGIAQFQEPLHLLDNNTIDYRGGSVEILTDAINVGSNNTITMAGGSLLFDIYEDGIEMDSNNLLDMHYESELVDIGQNAILATGDNNVIFYDGTKIRALEETGSAIRIDGNDNTIELGFNFPDSTDDFSDIESNGYGVRLLGSDNTLDIDDLVIIKAYHQDAIELSDNNMLDNNGALLAQAKPNNDPTQGNGIKAGNNNVITNKIQGSIRADNNGILLSGDNNQLTNLGVIEAINSGVKIVGIGNHINSHSTGYISGKTAIEFTNTAGSNTFVNSGVIQSQNGEAILGATGNELIIFNPGSSVVGDIDLGAGIDTIQVNTSGDHVGAISAIESLQIASSQRWNLTGDNASVVDQLLVSGGGVLSLAQNHTLFGVISVDNATLDITGQADTINIGDNAQLLGSGRLIGGLRIKENGSVSPGIGNTITVKDYQQDAGGLYQLSVQNVSGISDHLQVEGVVNIDPGAILKIDTDSSQNYDRWMIYKVISGSMTGSGFEDMLVDTQLDGVTARLLQTDDAGYLRLEVDGFKFVPFAKTNNQYQLANYLDEVVERQGIEAINPVYLLSMSQDIAGGFNLLSPEIYDVYTSNQFSTIKQIGSTVHQYLQPDNPTRESVWIRYLQDKSNYDKLDAQVDTQGVVLGLDRQFDNGSSLGFLAATTPSTVYWGNRYQAQGEVDGYYLGGYVDHAYQDIFASLVLGYATGAHSTTRQIDISASDAFVSDALNYHEKAKSDFDGHAFGASLNLDWQLDKKVGGWHLHPYAQIDYALIKREGFEEMGADGVNLQIESDNNSLLELELGARITRDIPMGQWQLTPDIKLGLVQGRYVDDREIRSSFAGSEGGFVVQGDSNYQAASMTVGAELSHSHEDYSLFARYGVKQGNKGDSKQASAGVMIRF